MGMMDQFKDKAEELANRQKDRQGRAKDEVNERAPQGGKRDERSRPGEEREQDMDYDV